MRTPMVPEGKVNLEQLGLVNSGLMTIEGVVAERYRTILKKVFDLDCDVDSFRIDKRGISPELSVYFKEKYGSRFEYGENYLNMRSANRFMVVVSPEQKSAHLVAQQTSYENDLYDLIYKTARHTIEDMTESEALYGELENGISFFHSPSDLLQLRTVEVSLDSVDGTIQSLRDLRKMSEELGNDGNALNEEYIGKMRALVRKVKDSRNRAVSDIFPVKREVHCFYVEFFNGVYCLRNFRNTGDLRTIFVSHGYDEERDLGDGVKSFDIHDSELIDTLHKHKFLRYDKGLVLQRMGEIEESILLQKGVDVLQLDEARKKAKVVELHSELPQTWHELRDINTKLNSGRDARLDSIAKGKSYETRLKLSEAVSKEEIINHMLAHLDPSDYGRLYAWNRRLFVRSFETLPLNVQRYMAQKALETMKGGKKK